MHILIMFSLHLDVYTLAQDIIKIAFLIWADRHFYKQVLVFLSLLKYIFIRSLKSLKSLLYPGIMPLFLF